ncbi:MAG: 4-hydroxy-3-methylbut-2-enyl diphosphate reductase [Nitrospinota bacterium]|nr:MAG: 4-hydroxy-3-methylbut-2-enyl diphosphate reductase [Nitrospinota bacterium]
MRLQRVILAGPRGFCAGVERAIDVVERALELFDETIYVRKEIVHNRHVVEALMRQGAVFVDELDEVPPGATVIFSAHGVSPQVWKQAEEKQLRVIDATCPLVTKVHFEVRRFVQENYSIILIGHLDHDEVIGTMGEAPEHIQVIGKIEEVARVEVPDPNKVVCLTQTTLSVDDTKAIVQALKARFPAMILPSKDDICYATQNRQMAVKALAQKADLILVLGAKNSSNSNRLREVAEMAGTRAILVGHVRELNPKWFEDIQTIGITAGASTPEFLVQEVVEYCRNLGATQVEELIVTTEDVRFALPTELHLPSDSLTA